MTENVQVDPIDLLLTASRVHDNAADLHSAASSATSQVAASAGGWVGHSAGALDGLVAHWETTTHNFHSTLTTHANHFHSSGQEYRDCDQESANQLQSDAPAVTLNLD